MSEEVGYQVLIRRHSDGIERWHRPSVTFNDSTPFWWTEGNMGCDCNLHSSFGWDAVDDSCVGGVDCGESLYKAVKILKDNGEEISLDWYEQYGKFDFVVLPLRKV